MKIFKTAYYEGRLVVADDGPGTIEGYAVLWGVPDVEGDTFARGAFAKTVQERVAKGGLPMMQKHALHGGDTGDQLGTLIEVREDGTGLWFRGVYAQTELAQESRRLAKGGHIKGASVGAEIIRSRKLPSGAREMLECALLEITLTSFPRQQNLPALIAARAEVTLEGRPHPTDTPEGRRAAIRQLQCWVRVRR